MDPVSLIVDALTAGAAQGLSDSMSDAVRSAYNKLKLLVSGRLSWSKSTDLILVEHAADPETWRAPLSKALMASGVATDETVLEAARYLMALLDSTGTTEGKYRIEIGSSQGVQIGDGNHQLNTFNATISPDTVFPQSIDTD